MPKDRFKLILKHKQIQIQKQRQDIGPRRGQTQSKKNRTSRTDCFLNCQKDKGKWQRQNKCKTQEEGKHK